MAEMKELFINLQERTCKKLNNLGVSQETIFTFEHLFLNRQQERFDFFDFAEKMAGYAMTIYILSEITGYDRNRLWSIWQELVQDFMDGNAVYDTLDEEWGSFKKTTQEKDW
ncbi:MAG: hypothetical protein Q4E91_06045 [Lachnospiraceae bacterium]|nr:hypothetical protein [Lachnospiraceae bacterium]